VVNRRILPTTPARVAKVRKLSRRQTQIGADQIRCSALICVYLQLIIFKLKLWRDIAGVLGSLTAKFTTKYDPFIYQQVDSLEANLAVNFTKSSRSFRPSLFERLLDEV
jgi:hypothetical protein